MDSSESNLIADEVERIDGHLKDLVTLVVQLKRENDYAYNVLAKSPTQTQAKIKESINGHLEACESHLDRLVSVPAWSTDSWSGQRSRLARDLAAIDQDLLKVESSSDVGSDGGNRAEGGEYFQQYRQTMVQVGRSIVLVK